MISKGERVELKSVVRQQFKVLRAELEQRQMEMLAEIEEGIASRFAGADQEWAVLQHEVHEAVMECNRKINDSLANHGFQVKSGTERMWISHPPISQPQEDRSQMRRLAHRKLDADVKAAVLRLDREEADILRTLAMGAIESEEARAFLANIPTVGELVPAARLAELEAGLSDEAAS